MPGKGPPPKPPEQRQRRNKVTTLELVAEDHPAKPPALGPRYRFEGKQHRWLPSTRTWWRTWTTSPQAALFTKTDWESLRRLAPLIDRYLRGAIDPRILSEIRLTEGALGATPADRQRLGWKIVEAASAPEDPRRRARKDPRRRLSVVR